MYPPAASAGASSSPPPSLLCINICKVYTRFSQNHLQSVMSSNTFETKPSLIIFQQWAQLPRQLLFRINRRQVKIDYSFSEFYTSGRKNIQLYYWKMQKCRTHYVFVQGQPGGTNFLGFFHFPQLVVTLTSLSMKIKVKNSEGGGVKMASEGVKTADFEMSKKELKNGFFQL